eukprot:scaffold224487_cov31-Tisochrysis_lutea.AAC.1
MARLVQPRASWCARSARRPNGSPDPAAAARQQRPLGRCRTDPTLRSIRQPAVAEVKLVVEASDPRQQSIGRAKMVTEVTAHATAVQRVVKAQLQGKAKGTTLDPAPLPTRRFGPGALREQASASRPRQQ